MTDSDSEFHVNRNPPVVGVSSPSKKRKNKGGSARNDVPAQQILTLDTVRVLMHSSEGIMQIIQALKENGCTMPEQKIAEILQFIIQYVDITIRGPSIPQLPKRELCNVMDYVFPSSHAEIRQRPGKGFKAVMKSLLRCMGVNDSIIQAFAGSQRFYKHVSWTEEGRQKVTEAMAYRAGTLASHPAGLDEGDEEDEDKKTNINVHVSGGSGNKPLGGGAGAAALISAVRASKSSSARPSGRSGFTPKYDVLFSRTTWSYYLRVFMPMCDPQSLQQGIKLDLLRGQLSLKGRYSATASLPPWVTQNESLTDLEVVQPLPSVASGEFSIDIPLPFDVDRSARKEVLVTDIGIIVSLKRLKEDIPQMEFKVHTFSNAPAGPAGIVASSSSSGVRAPVAGNPALLLPQNVAPLHF